MATPAKKHAKPTFGAVVLFVVAVVVAVGLVVGGTAYAVYTTGHQVGAGCHFWKALATAPIVPVPPVQRPSRFGVTIVASSLEAYNGTGCGHLDPSPSLVRWAGYYHLKIPR